MAQGWLATGAAALPLPGILHWIALPGLLARASPALALEMAAIAGCAAAGAWAIHRGRARWRPIAVGHGEATGETALALAEAAADFDPGLAPAPASLLTDAASPARGQFVAMAFPAAAPAMPQISGDHPLEIACQPIRVTLTLTHAGLHYRLQCCNRGAQALGPLLIRAALAGVEPDIAQAGQTGLDAQALPLCHYLDGLPAGASIGFAGELRVPLGAMAAMRLGAARFVIPLLRLSAESAGESRPVICTSANFAIGLSAASGGSGIQPFPLDLGPGIWRKLRMRKLTPGHHP